MESDLPVPIDDSITYQRPPSIRQEEEHEEVYRQEYYYPPPQPPVYMMPPAQQSQKKDIFSELERIHWIIFVATVLLAFFIGKSMSTPVILRSS
jgi:hypothetical protein